MAFSRNKPSISFALFLCALFIFFFHFNDLHRMAGPFHEATTSTEEPISTFLTTESSQDIKSVLDYLNSVDFIRPNDICKDPDLFMVIYVQSDASHFSNRALIRSSWADPHLHADVKTQVFFFISQPPDAVINSHIHNEFVAHNDLVILPFVEHYRNVSMKTISAFYVLADECQHVPYVLKTDDDVVVNIFSVMEFLRFKIDAYYFTNPLDEAKTQAKRVPLHDVTRGKLLMCHVWLNPTPYRESSKKWHITYKQYSHDCYPQYCSGAAYIMSIHTVIAINEASMKSHMFPFDDVLITGFLAQKVGIRHIHIHKQVTGLYKDISHTGASNLSHSVIFHAPNSNVYQMMWNHILISKRLELELDCNFNPDPCQIPAWT